MLDQRASRGKGLILPGRSASKWDVEGALVSGAEGAGTPSIRGMVTKVHDIGRNLAYKGIPNSKLSALPHGEPMEDVVHIGRYTCMVRLRYPAYETGSRAENEVQAIEVSSRKANA